jgi:hypothetical protein
MRKALAVAMIVLALVLAIVPIFSDCQSAGRELALEGGRTIPMKCHWTGIAEAGVAVPLALAGVIALGVRRKETTRVVAIFGAAAGVLAILFPTVLIGVCSSASMPCNMLMKPILIAAGILAIVASIALFFVARDSDMPEAVA